jgi:beta-carotene 3-hydroxylase
MTMWLVVVGTLVLAEPMMTLVHRFVFHGPLWCEHESHHRQPTARSILRNDRLWIGPLATSALLVVLGGPVLTGIGIGLFTYVAAYIFAHDGIAHGRF